MNCRSVREMAGPYLYGDLSPEQMKAIRTHAQQCSACREDLRTQVSVLSAMPNAVPELSDEERQRIAWTVKGAVKASEPEVRKSRFRFQPAYALAAAVIVGMVAIKVVGSISPGSPAQRSVSGAKVKVVEVQTPKPANKKIEGIGHKSQDVGQETRTAQDAGVPQVEERDGVGQSPEPRVHHRRRDYTSLLAFRGRHEKKPAPVAAEPPAPVVDSPQAPDVKMDKGDTTLPEPKGENSAETTPTNTDIDGTGSSE